MLKSRFITNRVRVQTVHSPQWLWRHPGIALVLVLLLLPFIIFGSQALLRSVFYILDVQFYFYPYHVLAAALVAQGHLPLWNPYAFSGIPLLGDGQTALFYPPNWLFFLLPGPAALNYDVLVQFSLAGAGMYVYMRGLGLWRLPAFVSALAYMFGGFMTTRVVHLSILSGAALLPLLFYSVERVLGTASVRWFAAAAVVVALQAMAGHPQVPIYTVLALGLYVAIRAVERATLTGSWRWLGTLPLRFIGIYVLGYALAAVQLLPWIEFARLSPRAAGTSFDFVFGTSMTGSEWLLFLFPYVYGSLQPGFYGDGAIGIATAIKIWEHSAYVGILPLALAGVALFDLGTLRKLWRRPADRLGIRSREYRELHQRWFAICYFALLLLLSLLLAAGKHTPLAGLVYATPALGKLRNVERSLVLAAFALTALCAFGLQHVLEADLRNPRQRQRLRLLFSAAMIIVVPLAVVWLAQQPAMRSALGMDLRAVENLQLHRPNAYVPVVLACASATLLAWWSWRPSGIATHVLTAMLVLLDVASYAALFNPTIDPQLYRREPQSVDFLRKDDTLFRKATFFTPGSRQTVPAHDPVSAHNLFQEALVVSWGMVYGTEDINGFNSLQPRRYTDYLVSPDAADVSYGYLTDEQLLQPDSPILSSLNVKYLIVPRTIEPEPRPGNTFRQVYTNAEVRIYENTQVYPRAYFVDTVRGETDRLAVLRTVTAEGFDGRRLALVESPTLPDLPQSSSSGAANVEFTRHDLNQIELITVTGAPRFLVLSEMYFPGWRAYINGVETPIFRTNYLFRGILVPAGEHTISFQYRPTSVILGAAISAIALLTIVALLAFDRRRSDSDSNRADQNT